jgi:membrane protease subunit HflC
MSRTALAGAAVVVVLLAVLSMSALFSVNQAQQALVLQFGAPVRPVEDPGLHVKIPFAQNVVYFDRRLLDIDTDPQEVTMLDQKRLVVDAFARYRIVNPLQFYQTVGSEANMRVRLSAIVISKLRDALGKVPFAAVLTEQRAQLMRQITVQVVAEAQSFGVKVFDVRIMRADLHPDNSAAIYGRMQTERERQAKQERAEGAETAQTIRAQADRDRTVILAEAQKQAQILRGQGDAEATAIYADAFNRDPSFFEFYRSLQAYRAAFGDGSTTTMVLSPDSEFMKYFRDEDGTAAPDTGKSLPPRTAGGRR